MIPGRSTRTMRGKSGPFTDNEMTSLLIVWLLRTEFFMRNSISFLKAANFRRKQNKNI